MHRDNLIRSRKVLARPAWLTAVITAVTAIVGIGGQLLAYRLALRRIDDRLAEHSIEQGRRSNAKEEADVQARDSSSEPNQLDDTGGGSWSRTRRWCWVFSASLLF